MSSHVRTTPVKDNVAQAENDLAVGEDLEFQRRWWRFEHVVWWIFLIIIILDLAGIFGRGPLAKAHDRTADSAMNLQYERFERFETPSILTIHFGSNAVRDGVIQLWVSDSVVKSLGNQRIIPQPQSSVLADQGILYTFPAGNNPNSVEFALEPTKPGIEDFTLRLPSLGDQLVHRVIVYP